MIQTYEQWICELDGAVAALRYEDPLRAEKLTGQAEVLNVLLGRITRDAEEVIRLCGEYELSDYYTAALKKLYSKSTIPVRDVSGPDDKAVTDPKLRITINLKRRREEGVDVNNEWMIQTDSKSLKADTTKKTDSLPIPPAEAGLNSSGRTDRRQWALQYVNKQCDRSIRTICTDAHVWFSEKELDDNCRLCYFATGDGDASLRTPCCGRCLCADCVTRVAVEFRKVRGKNKGFFAMYCPSCREQFSKSSVLKDKNDFPLANTVDRRVLRCLDLYYRCVTDRRPNRCSIGKWLRKSIPDLDEHPPTKISKLDNTVEQATESNVEPRPCAVTVPYTVITEDISDDESLEESRSRVEERVAEQHDMNEESNDTDPEYGPLTIGQHLLNEIWCDELSASEQVDYAHALQQLHELCELTGK